MTMTTTSAASLVDRARELGPLLRKHAAQADRDGRLPRACVEAIREAGFMRMYVPRSLGGLEVDPLTHLLVQEELARHDAAAGWLLQACGSGAWWCSRLPTETAERIYADGPDQVIAVSFATPVEGVRADGGFVLSGRRAFASNVSDASWIWLTMLHLVGGEPESVDGAPVTRAVFFPASQATVVPTWDALGLRGTDSNDVAVDELFVPEAATFRIGLDHVPGPHYDGALYRAPAMVLVATIVPAVGLGLARNALDAFRELADKVPFASASALHERATAQARYGRAEGALRAARALLLNAVSDAWTAIAGGSEPTLDERADVLLACAQAVRGSVEAVESIFGAAGTSAITRGGVLERCFRDVQVLRQHGFVGESRFETVAQVAFGLEPDMGFVAL